MNERFNTPPLSLGTSAKLTTAGSGGVVSYTGGTSGTLTVMILDKLETIPY